jgi:hypothetical protein
VTGLIYIVTAAWAGDEGLGANLLAMGGVGAAASRDNAAISLNPGLLALHSRYDLQGQFQYGPYGGLHWGGSGMDAKTSKVVALGIAYKGDRSNPPITETELPGWWEPGVEIPNHKRLHDFAAGLAVPVLGRRLSFGLGANVSYFDHDREGTGWTLDGHAGIGARPIDPLVLGVAVRNFAPTELDRPLSVRGGVRVQSGLLPAVEVDAEWRDSPALGMPLWLGAGVEVPIRQGRVRAGWNRDPYLQDALHDGLQPGLQEGGGVHSISIGVGYEEGGAAIEYGLVLPLIEDLSFGDTIHAFQLRFSASAEEKPPL